MTRIPIAIEVRCLRVLTRWALRKETLSGEWMLVPEVNQDMECRLATIDDPWELRNQFFRMRHDEKAAFEFLNQVGVWRAHADPHVSASAGEMLLSGDFGYRLFFGRALPLTLEQLWRDQDHWANLLRSPSLLRAEFGPAPADDAPPFKKFDFAAKANLSNTLPLHLEWRRSSPNAVIQPITGWELLIATAQVDLVSGAAFQVCQRMDCGIPFSGRRRKYCQWYCGHIESVRAHREKGRNNLARTTEVRELLRSKQKKRGKKR
jgi:hypothetical protein